MIIFAGMKTNVSFMKWIKYRKVASDLVGIPLTLCGIYVMLYFLRSYYDVFTPEAGGDFYIKLMYGLLKVMFCSMGAFGFMYSAFRKTLWEYYWRPARHDTDLTAFQQDFFSADKEPHRLWRIVLFYCIYFLVFFALLHVKIGAQV